MESKRSAPGAGGRAARDAAGGCIRRLQARKLNTRACAALREVLPGTCGNV